MCNNNFESNLQRVSVRDPQHHLDEDSDIDSDSGNTECEELLRMTKVPEFIAISTPIPDRKPLQISEAKRQGILLLEADVSPKSVANIAVLDSGPASLSLWEGRGKNKGPLSASILSKIDLPPLPESSPQLAQSKKVRKPRKRVHFKQTCAMRRTLSLKDITEKEIHRTWLTTKDYKRMQLRDEMIVGMIETGRCKKDTCVRGLESKMENTVERRLSLRHTAMEAVMEEQERQWDCFRDRAHENDYFFYDFESFSYVCGPTSEDAQLHAQQVARQDRIEAEKIISSPMLFKSKGAEDFLFRSGPRFTRRQSWSHLSHLNSNKSGPRFTRRQSWTHNGIT